MCNSTKNIFVRLHKNHSKNLCILPLAIFEKIVYNIYVRLRGTKKLDRAGFSKIPQKPTKKFVQDYHLTNSKKYDIIYIERKEKGKVPKGQYKTFSPYFLFFIGIISN